VCRNGAPSAAGEPAKELAGAGQRDRSERRPADAPWRMGGCPRGLLNPAQGCRLDAVLVLRIQGGNDIFCSVSGAYAPSFFGVSLPALAGLSRHALGSGSVGF